MIGWTASFIECVGMYMVGHKLKWGFLVTAVGNVLWILIALGIIKSGYSGLILILAAALFINIRNFLKWHKGD